LKNLNHGKGVDVSKGVIMLTPLEVKHGPNFFKKAEEEEAKKKEEGMWSKFREGMLKRWPRGAMIALHRLFCLQAKRINRLYQGSLQ
jgi:hypothetical protein